MDVAAGNATSGGGTAMDMNMFWHWPATVLLVLAGVLLLLCLAQLPACRRHVRDRRPLAASSRIVLTCILFLASLTATGAGLSLRGYQRINAEVPVARLDATRLGPQHWLVALTRPDGRTRRIALHGDAFRIEAVVVKWMPAALVFGHAPALYRLDRISGRYDDVQQAMSAPRTVVALSHPGPMDLWRLKRRFPQWLPGVDAVYGSGTYLPLVDDGHYRVHFMRSGALIARPADAATARKLARHGGA